MPQQWAQYNGTQKQERVLSMATDNITIKDQLQKIVSAGMKKVSGARK